MLYFSELKDRKVVTPDGVYVGKLKDVIFLASDSAKVTKLVVETPHDPNVIVPMDYVKRMNGGIILKKNYHISKLKENELFLVANLLDNQIIDISGDKIVRVNDVAIQDRPGYFIAGVDIGLIGILRWFGLEDFFIKFLSRFRVRFAPRFLSWADIQTLELTRGHVKIKKEQTKLEKIRPEDLADYLEQTNVANAKGILKVLDEKSSIEVINNLNLNYQTALLKQFNFDQAAKIISLMDPEEAVDVLLTLSRKRRENIMSLLNDSAYKEISYLLSLSKTPIGDLLTTEFLAVESDDRVKDVLEKVRAQTSEFLDLPYVYVLNKDKQLVGVFNLHELLLQSPDAPVYKFMTQNMVTIHLSTPEVVVARKIVKYRLYALPVVDKEKHMLGLVMFDDVMNSQL